MMEAVIIRYVVYLIDVALTLAAPVSEFLLDVFCRVHYGKTKRLPEITDKILLMSATKLAKKVRKREVSPVDLMEAYIERIRVVQPVLNACVDYRFQEALADARAVDRMLASGVKTESELETEMPLLGIPFSCKEILGVKNLAQTNGLKSHKNRKALEDGEAVALFRRAGAIPVVVTNIPTMTLWWDTSNPLFGTTKNPYNSYRAAGGSSGGDAALISSAGSLIAIGNDVGGSIRFPCSMCGIYGHKPSRGIISNKTFSPFVLPELDAFFSTGPLCRYAEDLHLLVSVLSGVDKGKLCLDERVNFKNVKVYYIEEFPGYFLSATPDVKAAVRKAAKHFEDYGITSKSVEMKELKYAFEIWQSKLFEAGGAFVRTVLRKNRKKFSLFMEYTKCIFGLSDFDFRILYYSTIEFQREDKFYKKCIEMYDKLECKFQEILHGDAILILPVIPEHPPHSIATIPKIRRMAYSCIFNALGLPVTTVPAGFSKGLPIGLQVVAAKDNDRLTLAAAVELNRVFGGWTSPCPIFV